MTNTTRISSASPHYPDLLLENLGDQVPGAIYAIGNSEGLTQSKMAFFCSVRCPGSLIIRAHDYAHELRDRGVVVISGFHSPVEKECLTVLLQGGQPVIICPARSIERMRIPPTWKKPLEAGRLLILSPFEEKHRRANKALAQQRNEFVAALADKVFVAYANPDGKLVQLCKKVVSWGKPIATFNSQENAHITKLGAISINEGDK